MTDNISDVISSRLCALVADLLATKAQRREEPASEILIARTAKINSPIIKF